MKVSKYTKLGILIVLSVTILIWGLSYLKGNDIFKKIDQYHVVYNRIDGLSASNDVLLSGYKIGQVKKISFLPDHSGRLLVTFTIDSSIKLPKNTVAQIVSSDLMGTRIIKINLGTGSEFYSANDTIPGDVEDDLKEQVSMQVLPIKNKAEELLGTLDSAITVLTVIFNEDARKNLSESFKNINQTVYNIEKTTADLQEIVSTKKGNVERIITNLDTIITALNSSMDNFENTLSNISAISDTLARLPLSPIVQSIADATAKVNNILVQLESTDNTAGLLLNDDQLYASVSLLADNLNLLMNDIRVNPERYLKFSALDLGRKVYVNATGDVTGKIIFKVHLVSTETPISTDTDRFKGLGEIEEYIASEAYSYLVGSTSSFTEIVKLHEKALKKFPDASIVAFKNGRLIKLERALKSLK
ncbi:phospholipid/cholesterol/gamma-HCH transport system substrate-binding protein [Mariniphaga anaerophila]|uniref:Phospholipid/cholesterol/gamma-HCH transport system substrate-binding protein n=1 Tax=Mariniphaga anaerophila TaxID=1484053 RepID=A0A1M4VAN4_9BACT|nr:MlaD family protein [Mariniphaga anaerophila]SHE66065.1 phospholipid/cholesterol/gamma-HCH transport system substrate-binding protein [Mariniphaga anaerophila]